MSDRTSDRTSDSEIIIKIVPGEKHTPYSLAEKLGARCILESSSIDKGRERYSVLLIKEAFKLIQDQEDILFLRQGEQKPYKVVSRARDILDVCSYFADQHDPVRQGFPLPSGGVGFLSYEFARFCDTVNFAYQADPLGLPDAAFIFGHVFVIFDHYTDMLYLIGINYKEAKIDLQVQINALEKRLSGQRGSDLEHDIELGELEQLNQKENEKACEVYCLSNQEEDEAYYRAGVDKVREQVIAGNLLQAVLSRRVVLYSDIKALQAYRYLRSNNPSPYLFYLDFGNFQIFGASPEVHVKVKEGNAVLRPIAGTRRRGSSKDEDKALEAELLADPKEKAEHLMLVDLGRNDLGRVCEGGSVKVSELMGIERYSHVMHIVSQVEGKLAKGKNGIDALRATFPAGTVSGAPKIRAMEVLSKIEKERRGIYAGAIGYIEPGGDLDTCIAIRTGIKIGKKLIFQAGAGIVYDSTAERELEETREKMATLLRSVGLDPHKALSARLHSNNFEDDTDTDFDVSVGFSAAGTSVKSKLAHRKDKKPQEKTEIAASKTVTEPSVQSSIDNLVAEKSHASQFAQNLTDHVPDPWTEQQEDMMPLDWDFDPEGSGGSKEIQLEIDALIRNRAEHTLGGTEELEELEELE